jgi:hypothetical protein
MVVFLGLSSSREVRSLFRNVLYDYLRGSSGSRDFVISGTDTTYAYTPVLTKGNEDGSNNNKHHYFLTLSVIAPHYKRRKKFTANEKENIYVTAHMKGSEVVVSVKDSGTGIDLEMLPKLFTKFSSTS